MSGAEHLEGAPFLMSKYFINVDNEDEAKICVGNAGGFEANFVLCSSTSQVSTVSQSAGESSSSLPVAVRLVMSGFQGGHTGVDINKGRCNAIKAMMLLIQQSGSGVRIASWDAGVACNAIPAKCVATVLVPLKDLSAFQTSMKSHWERLVEEYLPIEGVYDAVAKKLNHSMALEMTPLDAQTISVPSASFTSSLIHLALALPDGVLRMIPSIPHTVETSIALVRCNIVHKDNECECTLWMHARSSSSYQLDVLNHRLHAVAKPFSVVVNSPLNKYPSWKANPYSHMVEVMQKAAVALTGKQYEQFAVHAGLECGYILSHYPSMDCVSIGPDCRDVHTPAETVNIPSVERSYAFLKKTLELLD